MPHRFYYGMFSLLLIVLFAPLYSFAQKKVVVAGLVKDRQSDEHIPFATVLSKQTGAGTLTDSSGIFHLILSHFTTDTLVITSVGYKAAFYIIPAAPDSTFATIPMDIAPISKEAVVKVKFNRALWLWNRIIKNKPRHDNSRFNTYSYEIYNKLELDIVNISKDKLGTRKVLKPFGFITDYIDTTESKPYLPVFLTETISDFYFQRNPRKVKEVIRASKTNGINNESVTKMLGGTYQNVNVYHNFIPVFDKQFVSPFHDNGDNYYHYKLLDTQYLNNKRLVHLSFVPKRKGENTFEGDCWIHDTTYAIQKITLRPSGEANINFIKNLTLIQEFKLIDDSTWFLAKDKSVAEISILGKSAASFKGRKTATYKNVLVNNTSITNTVALNRKAEEVKVEAEAGLKEDSYWELARHEELTKNERGIYKMIDTIQSLPGFKRYSDGINFLATGYKNIGNYQVGPWFNWVTGNSYEGTRVRFDLGTNQQFSKKFYLHGYAAYGFSDEKLKGKGEIFYLPNKNPRFYLYTSFRKDLDNGVQYYDEVTTDNIFALAIRKAGVPLKFQKVTEENLEMFKEFHSGFSFLLSASHKTFEPLRNLPGISFFEDGIKGEPLNNFETSIRLRYAYLETFLENAFYRTSLGSQYPIIELKYSKGWTGVFKSSYSYHKLNATVHDYVKVPPIGSIYYNFFAGKIFGTLPFPMLEIHPGNELYYYNKYAFNMMNRFEFISDRYAGFNFEHNIGNGIFRIIPITRKLKFRQFYSAKGVWGNLSEDNRKLNFVGDHAFQTLDNKLYLEVGTGVDNILKVLRFDFIWRLLPQPLPKAQSSRFGVFGSFRLSF